jgi:hypothetical protein
MADQNQSQEKPAQIEQEDEVETEESDDDEEEAPVETVNSRKRESILAPAALREDLLTALKLIKQGTRGMQDDLTDAAPVVHEILLT